MSGGLELFQSIALSDLVLLVVFTALTYVLGIIFDRLFDIIIDSWDKFLKKEHIMEDQYEHIRTILYDQSKMIQNVFDYTKSRVRIIRSWMFLNHFIIKDVYKGRN